MTPLNISELGSRLFSNGSTPQKRDSVTWINATFLQWTPGTIFFQDNAFENVVDEILNILISLQYVTKIWPAFNVLTQCRWRIYESMNTI